MSIFRWLAVGTLGYLAYRVWQPGARRSRVAMPRQDDGLRTAPHGDPVLRGEELDAPNAPLRPAAQASRGFGEA